MNKSIYTQTSIFLILMKLVFSPLTLEFHNPMFIRSGVIEYEKSVNMYAKLKKKGAYDLAITKESISAYEMFHPQFLKTKAVLKFWPTGSDYNTLEDEIPDAGTTLREPWAVVRNKVRMDFQKDSVSTLRNVFGQELLVSDKRKPILWKYTNEVRDIAGYECKRANGLISDSIYVVAFYSVKIVPPGGPECFSGLPGMILGIAIPNENVSWFATTVKDIEINKSSPEAASSKRKPISWQEYKTLLEKSIGTGVGSKESLSAFLL